MNHNKEDIVKCAEAIKDFCVEYTYKEDECPFIYVEESES